jgi:hypothetical protein
MARSSGRLSRTRFWVRFPQSPGLVRWARAKSQQLLLGMLCVSISISIAPSMLRGKCVGDCASGVETAPKLEMDVGDASSKCLRLMPIVSNLDLSLESTRSCDTLAVFARGSKEGGTVSCVEVIMSEGWLDTRQS